MPQPRKKALQQQREKAPPAAAPAPAQPAAAAKPAAKAAPQPALSWSYNPWVDSRARGWKRPPVALALLLLCCLIAAWSLAERRVWQELLAWTSVGMAISMAMCAALFLPVQYRLDEKGVTVSFLLVPSFRPWEHYRNYYVHDTGVHLTTMPQPSPLDAFRGHFIQYGGGDGQREKIEPYLAAHIKKEAPAG